MAIKVKDLIAFLQKHETDDWTISCLTFDDYHGFLASFYKNEKEIPNKVSYDDDDGPAHEWDRLSISADEELDEVDIEFSHEDDIFK